MMWYGHGYYPAMFGFGLGWVIPVVVVLFVVLTLASRRHYHDEDSGDSALKILRDRYAKGDIDKKQFDDMKKDLN